MNKEKLSFGGIFICIVFSALVLYLCIIFEPISRTINNYYQVYLGGEKIGLIKSEKELYEIIDSEQQEIKDKYNVDKVYSPSGLEIQPVATYNNNLMTEEEIYHDIKDLDPFTIEGYEVTIKYSDGKRKNLYILNKEDLDAAVKNTVLAFVDEKAYENYLNGTQEEITDEGTEITDIYLDSEVTLKKTYISTEEEIITDVNTLSKYFLFGTSELDKTYKVKSTDTIETIAYKNKLGVSDFLIANPDIGGENALLAIGQDVNVAAIEPLSNIVVESFDTEYQKITYDTKMEFDKTLNADQSYVKQQGSNGLSKVTYATKEMNGVILKTSLVKEDVISQAVDKIIVYGAKNVVYYGNTTYWAWPTSKPFRISSYYGYRVHPIRGEEHFHTGIDVTGTASRNIYAIQSGTVIETGTGWSGGMGNHVRVDHGNGYVSLYMHLKKIIAKKGDKVEKGQVVGIMGCTGSCTGTHLHLTVYKNGSMINPLNLYR